MPPTLIIDGYNLIRTSPTLSSIDRQNLEDGRDALISRLSEYRKVRRFPIIVVFDGTGFYHLSPQGEARMGIRILYSPSGRTADDVIVSLASKQGKEYVVVTSDRGICQRLESADCVCVDSETFDRKVDQALYELFKGVGLDEEEANSFHRKKGHKKKLPKKLRRRREILKKL